MSIVGPRPERPEIAVEYEKEMPEFRLRLQARAGLTGYAQVYGKYNTTPYDKLQMGRCFAGIEKYSENWHCNRETGGTWKYSECYIYLFNILSIWIN